MGEIGERSDGEQKQTGYGRSAICACGCFRSLLFVSVLVSVLVQDIHYITLQFLQL